MAYMDPMGIDTCCSCFEGFTVSRLAHMSHCCREVQRKKERMLELSCFNARWLPCPEAYCEIQTPQFQ